jgi:uncharacterized protein (TIGR02246 family)
MSNELQDRQDIIDLAWAYSAAASRRDGDSMAKLFTRDGRLGGIAALVGQGDKDLVGREAIAQFFAPLYKETIELVHHLSQVVGLEITADRATATTMIVEYARPKGGNLLLVLGQYEDEIVRVQDGWRFARRTLQTKLFTQVSEIPFG